ncbi:MAG: LytTR family transcriptional regulator DNA-binding domain-containing protein [Defluviitaleaceae bacterium]|nr:LytTR family transcriptional regulator DNA-binding domain-containing protein [Defluviitaleaceae bacterium]
MRVIIRDPIKDEEDSITICVRNMTENVLRAINLIKSPSQLTVYSNNNAYILPIADIFYVESVDLKTFVYTENTIYQAKQKLYEVESILNDSEFLRINRQTIINIRRIQNVSPAGGGRFQATLTNGEKLIVSRQNVSALKEIFGL